MNDTPLHYREATDIVAMLRDGAISSRAITAALLARIAALDPRLHSYAHVDGDNALRQAEAADARRARGEATGPLHGLPVAVKDLFWTDDMPTAAGMPIHAGYRAPADATVVARLRAAGAIIIGKLQMTEGAFAQHHPGIAAPLNPWGEALWPGASSSGAGVALAAGLCFGALGTDTGGSIRFPSAVNGVTGLKPGWGRVSRHGLFDFAPTLDHVGPMARSARDVALLLSVISGADPLDPTCAPEPAMAPPGPAEGGLAGLRIGIDRGWNEQGSDAETCAAIAQAVAVLEGLGARIVPVSVPDMRRAVLGWEIIAGTEIAVSHAETFPAYAADYGPALSFLIGVGRGASAMDYQRAQLDRIALRGAFATLMAGIDLLIAPALPDAMTTLDALDAVAGDAQANARLIGFTSPFNLTGQPALALPAGRTVAGTPIGMQFISGQGREDALLRAAIAYQGATAWHRAAPLA